MRDDVDFDVERMFGKPLKSKKDKGRGSKPDRGLDSEPRAPIGKTAAADFSSGNNTSNIEKMQDKN